MTSLRLFAIIAVAFSLLSPVRALELDVSIRAHRENLVFDPLYFADPLYLEVTIVNKGDKVVSAVKPDLDFDTFNFIVSAPETGTMIRARLGGQGFIGFGEPIKYLPGEPVKHYWYVFLPDMRWFDHPFWRPIQRGEPVLIWGVYDLTPRMSLRSTSLDVFVKGRSEPELDALREWAPKGRPDKWEPGPLGAMFGLQFHMPLVREQVVEAAKVFRKGELADLLQLTLQMQDLYAMKEEARDEANQKLVAWLRRQGDIKRQALALQTRMLTGSYRMTSTQQALEKLLADPTFMGNATDANK